MLKQLKVDNFKAWRTLDVQLGKVTGLFGTNSSGKSSLLQFLLLLKQTKTATDRGLVLHFGGPNDLVNLGTYQDIVHRRDETADLKWTLEWTLPKLEITDGTRSRGTRILTGDNLEESCQVGLEGRSPSARYVQYTFSDTIFAIEPDSENRDKFALTARDLGSDNRRKFRYNSRGKPADLPAPVKTYLFPDRVRTQLRDPSCLGDFEAAYEALMDSIFYLGPLREHPHRQYTWSGARPEGVGSRGERTVDAILAATAGEAKQWKRPSKKPKAKSLQGIVGAWLKELHLIDSFRISEIGRGTNLYHARVKTASDSPETMLTDVGFGVSQVLPVLVLLYYVPEGSIVLMEQPEIHLHPSVQSGLADVMLEVAETRDVQIIVESHSEHLLRRFQRRVAEGIPSSDLRLYFAHIDQGKANLSDLRLNDWGVIENWPDNFFGDEMGEIAAITEASLRRRNGASL